MLENINEDSLEKSNISGNIYSQKVIDEVDSVISKTFDIINWWKISTLNIEGKISDLNLLEEKIKKTTIRIKDDNSVLDKQPHEWGDAIALWLIMVYDFLNNIFNEDLAKLKNRLNTIHILINVLEKYKS